MSVLIVEDDDDQMELMVRALTRHKVNSFQAKTIDEAFRILEENKKVIRVICLDLILGAEHGFEFLAWRELSQEYSKIPVIVMTSYADIKTIKIALVKGATDFLIKPIDSDLFTDRLKELRIIPHRKEQK